MREDEEDKKILFSYANFERSRRGEWPKEYVISGGHHREPGQQTRGVNDWLDTGEVKAGEDVDEEMKLLVLEKKDFVFFFLFREN